MLKTSTPRWLMVGWLVLAACVLGACGSNMQYQPRYGPYQRSAFFNDDHADRPLEADTVARGDLRADTQLYTGMVDGKQAETFPSQVTQAVLNRGRERYGIYCSPCHGVLGDGNGIIVERGFSQPPSFHTDALRNAPPGLFFNVITNGYGVMYSYASRVAPADRWAIAAYIRALQLSQHASIDDVPPDQKGTLQEAKP